MKMTKPGDARSRRAILTGAAAAGVVAALPVASDTAHPDVELIRLGADFDRLHADLLLVIKEQQPIHDAFEDAVEKFEGRGCRQPVGGWSDLRKEVGVEAAIKRENDAFDHADEIAAQVRAIPARTIVGFAIKLKVLAYDCGLSHRPDAPDEEIEWPETCFHDLIREAESHHGALLKGTGAPTLIQR